MYADLHIHTIFSDGIETVENIVKKAKMGNVVVISITDHDCVEGVKKIKNLETGIISVSGVELTVTNRLHVLGYFIDENNKELNLKLDILKAQRAKWIIKLVENLKKQYDISIKGLIKNYGEITLYSITNHLIKLTGGLISKKEIYEKFIWNKEGILPFGGFPTFSIDESINLIKNSNGIPILAHPGLLFDNECNFEVILDELVDKGIQGIEIYHVSNKNYIARLQRYAQNRNLFITGGSDFHGKKNKNTSIGQYGLNQSEWESLIESVQCKKG